MYSYLVTFTFETVNCTQITRTEIFETETRVTDKASLDLLKKQIRDEHHVITETRGYSFVIHFITRVDSL
jgi:hypothetical protein